MWKFLIRKNNGLLGMNARNLLYIRPNNLKSAKRLADDKLLCKKKLKKNNLPVPELIAKISSRQELDDFDFNFLPASFVLKPNLGFGGEGILVVYGKKKSGDLIWIKADGSLVTELDLRNHIQNILDGSFSRTNTPDVAFFEERIKISKIFKSYSYKGMPDVRVIVYNNVPVMAMLRLATKESEGKANLQLGGIGCGIDMATGVTTSSVQGKSKIIDYLPQSRLSLRGIKIPYWERILEMAILAQKASGLGFLGADIAIDRERGPVFLELNARPGLSIQIANLDGLLARLKRVEGLRVKSVSHGIKIAKNLFGGEIEEEIEEISGKKIISTVEKVKLIGKNNQEVEVEAKIDTGAYSTSIDTDLAKKLGFETGLEQFFRLDLSEYSIKPENEKKIKEDFTQKYQAHLEDIEGVALVFSASGSSLRPVIRLEFEMDGEKVSSLVNVVERKNLKYPLLIGRKDLRKFLIQV